MLTIILSHLLAILSIIIAFAFGGKAERYGGIVIIAMILVTDCGLIFANKQFKSVDVVELIDDLIGFGGFAIIGIYGARIWPLWAASLQLISVGAHFVRALEIPVRPIVYAWMKGGPTWAVLVLLIVGSLINRRQRFDRESVRFSRS